MSEPAAIELFISNITASATLNTPLNLRHLARNMLDVEYNTRKFSALVHRMRTPKATCMISSNGYIICVGTNTIGAAMHALRKTKRSIARAMELDKKSLKLHAFDIHNIASTFSLGRRINVNALRCIFGSDAVYEPTLFSGLRIGVLGDSNKIKAIIFPSGKVILTGARNIESLKQAFIQLNNKIHTWIVSHTPRSENETACIRFGQNSQRAVL